MRYFNDNIDMCKTTRGMCTKHMVVLNFEDFNYFVYKFYFQLKYLLIYRFVIFKFYFSMCY